MSEPTSASTELAMLREVIQQFRRVLTELDRFLDWEEAERRELKALRAQVSELAREHARLRETFERLASESEHERREHAQLRSAHHALQEDLERAQEDLRTLRVMHESVLRERRDTYDVLDATLRRLKP